MLWCFRHRKSLSAYLDGRLPAGRRARLEKHLAACEDCRAVLEDLRAIGRALATLEAPPPPPHMASRILAHAKARQRERAPRGSLRRGLSLPAILRHALAGATTALLIGIAAGWLVGRHWSPEQTGLPVFSQTSEPDLLEIYNLDYLVDAPEGSLAGCYLTLLSEPRAGGE